MTLSYNEGRHVKGRHHEVARPELRRTVDALHNAASVHLTGGRKLGKTLLLHSLADHITDAVIAVHTLQSSGDRTERAVFEPLAATMHRAVAGALRRLGHSPCQTPPSLGRLNPFNDFLNWVIDVAEHVKTSYGHLPLIIALDEGEHLLRVRTEEPAILLGNLRALCEDSNLAVPVQLVIAGFHALHVYHSPDDGLSPLRNLCKGVSLGLLPLPLASSLYMPLLAKVPPERTTEISSWLDREAGGHPFVIQVLCHRLEQVFAEGPISDLAAVTADLDQHFMNMAFRSLCRVWEKSDHALFGKLLRDGGVISAVEESELLEYSGVVARTGGWISAPCERFNRWYRRSFPEATTPESRPGARAAPTEPQRAKEALETEKGIDVGLLTVLGPELKALQQALGIDDGARLTDRGDLYWRARIASRRDDPLTVVVHCVAGPGQQAAAAAATKLIERFKPGMLILSGIAAGRRGKVKIGDVAIPRAVIDTTLKVAEAGEVRGRPKIPALPHVVAQMVAAFPFDPKEWRRRFRRLMPRKLRPPEGRRAEYDEHVASHPSLHDIAIASDNVLLRDHGVLERQADGLHQQIRIGEMEAAGLIQACEARHPTIPWFVVRGVSDFGDELKSDAFHRLASLAAASYVAYFLEAALDSDTLGVADA